MKNALEGNRWLLWLGLQRQTVDARGRPRDVLGAMLGLWVAGALTWWGWGATSPWLAATMGASAVLLFAVPSSPLAQPWPAMVGNVMSALVGFAVFRWLEPTPAAAALAAGLALALMFPLRCVHPPGGAVAITAVLGQAAVRDLGFGFARVPVAVNSALLLGVALVWRRLTRPAPVHAPVVHGSRHSTADPAPQDRVGLTTADLDAALRDFNQPADIDRDALETLLRQAQMQAWQRRFGSVRCGGHHVARRRVGGVRHATQRGLGPAASAPHSRPASGGPGLAPTPGDYSDKAEVVGQIMGSPVQTTNEQESVVELVPRLSDQGLHHVRVVDGERRLSGMVTQSDLVAALYPSQLSGQKA